MDVNNNNPFREAVLKFYAKHKREIIDKMVNELIRKTTNGKSYSEIVRIKKEISGRRFVSNAKFFVPYFSKLEIIYEILGVKDFEELFATETDINNYLRITVFRTGRDYRQQEKMEILSVEKFDHFNIYYIDGMILNDEIHDQIELRIANQKSAEGDKYVEMPKDVFRLVVLNGNLRGPELIALCSTNQNLRNKCNHENYFIFRELLKKEFELIDLHDENPREIYIEMHRMRRIWPLFQRRLAIITKDLRKFVLDYSTPFDILYNHKRGLLFICLQANIPKEMKTYGGFLHFMIILERYKRDDMSGIEKAIRSHFSTRKLPSSDPEELKKLMVKFLSEHIANDRDKIENCIENGYIQLCLLSNVKYDLRIPGYSPGKGPVPSEDFENDVAAYVVNEGNKKDFEIAIKDAELIGIDLFHFTPEELDMLVTIHEFVMKGILSITYPLNRFL